MKFANSCSLIVPCCEQQSYGGQVGLGTFLSKGPEDKKWENRQACAAMQSKAEMNNKAKGSFFANILPKLSAPPAPSLQRDHIRVARANTSSVFSRHTSTHKWVFEILCETGMV